jgi:phosphoserine aminotransferase
MTFNFSAGPGVLPKPVLLQVQNELLNYKDTGSSVMEISHRSKEFQECIDQATSEFKALYDIPSNYKIIFMQGGATSQFSAVCYNLITDASQPVDYFVTGVWSDKAAIEAKRLGANVNVVFNSKASKHNGDIPADPSNLKWSANPAYIYYCDNETVHGVEMPLDWIDKLPHQKVPIICDMSSNFLSRPIDVKKFGVIFGGAQKV